MLGGSAALAAGVTARPALAVGAGAPGVATARDIVQGLLAETRAPSMSAAVSRGGRIVWAEAFGYADLEQHLPATIAGRYRLASVSKLIAGVTAARLAERGAIDLDRPIGRYRPTLPETHHRTTLRQLLAHTGGGRHYNPRDYDPHAPGGPIDYRLYRSTEDALAVFIHDPLVSVPGEAFNYSTFGYTRAAGVRESAPGRAFPALVARELVAPLGLPSLLPEVMSAPIPERVACYQVRQATGEVFRAPAINPAYKWAGGGYVGTASDIARFCPGSIAGARSIALLLPEADLAVVVLSNLSDLPVDPLSPAQRIAEAFLTA